jgi:type II secretory pathway component PulJ
MSRSARKAFTLAEVVMATLVTAVIGLAVTGVALSLSNLNEHSEQYYRYLQSGRVASARLQETLRRAHLVLVGSGDLLILWAADDNGDGQINLAELVDIYRDDDTGELIERSIVLGDSTSEAARDAVSTAVPLQDVMQAVDRWRTPLAAGAPWPAARRVLARDVMEFTVQCDEPTPMTRMVSFRLTTGRGQRVVRTGGAATLRADRTAYVGLDDQTHILSTTEVAADEGD